MYVPLFLVYATLSRFSGGTSEDNVDIKTIQVTAGEAVILPCKINVNNNDLPTVEWLKEDQGIAFLYRDGCETHEMKEPVFWYRTNLFSNELKNGNISLRLSNVQLSDAGRYTCMIRDGRAQKVVTLKLVVVAVSEPRLSVVSAEGDGLTVQCESNCWYPKPEIVFLDDREKSVGAEESKSSGPDSRGCFNVTRRFTVQTDTKRIICRVQQPQINQIRVTEIYIPGKCTWTLTVITVIAALVIVCLLAFIVVHKKCSNCVRGRKLALQSSPQSTTVRAAKGNLQRSQADNIENANVEHHDKDEIIRQLKEELNDLRSKQRIVLYHNQPAIGSIPSRSSPDMSKPINPPSSQLPHNKPEPTAPTNSNRLKSDNFPQNKDSRPGTSRPNPAPRHPNQKSNHSHSSPALWSDVAAVSPSPSSPSTSVNVVRSMSLSLPHRNIARSPRRSTMSVLSTNPFSPLENLSEDNELLLS